NSEASTRCRRGPRKPPEGPGKPGRQPARPRGKTRGMAVTSFSLTPGKRVLFLTRDPDLIRRQIAGELDLTMADLSVGDLLDDINTDTMTPAWVCFDHDPAVIARNAYAGLIVDGQRLIGEDD